MGGDLQIVARFPEGAVTIRNFAGIGEDGGVGGVRGVGQLGELRLQL